ncbi:pca operon transcription factor PcaQ [Pseudovibrio exalbescens]|uniref:LysR family transcriptional regulator n=1 Tax=Pseudovibrio exalbescens TaxID=197461 RepID=A0A1U7JLX4_9HYPH|nr:pca operon transcription factor PcaQ [Pseudovibrio exalbescens]OKL45692.1 LysR family transcriptional regulator [Pseudovibrio exalbescens]
MNNIRRLKLRHLEAFVEVARLSSVSRAAEVLNLTQPAVTRTIRELEEICGRPLIEKDGRGIKISQFGEMFLKHAGTSLAAARNGINALAQFSAEDGPMIRLGALPTVSAALIPDAVDTYIASGMRNRLHIVTGENKVLLNQLRNGELDMVMGRLPAPENMQNLTFEPLYRESVVFAVDASHPLAGDAQVSVDQLGAYPVLMPSADSIIRPFVDRLFIEQGIPEPQNAIETVSDSFGRAFTRAHMAIWIISRGVISAEIQSGQFVELPIDTSSTRGSVGLVVRSDQSLGPASQFFADILKNLAAASLPANKSLMDA